MATQPHITKDVDLARLESIFEQTIDDEHASAIAFTEGVNAIDWDTKDADTFKAVASMAISLGALNLARSLANRGHELHPESDALARLALVIAPAKVIARDLPPVPTLKDSRAWLRDHRNEYFNQWVALKGGTLVGNAPTRDQLLDLINHFSRADNILVTWIGNFEA